MGSYDQTTVCLITSQAANTQEKGLDAKVGPLALRNRMATT